MSRRDFGAASKALLLHCEWVELSTFAAVKLCGHFYCPDEVFHVKRHSGWWRQRTRCLGKVLVYWVLFAELTALREGGSRGNLAGDLMCWQIKFQYLSSSVEPGQSHLSFLRQVLLCVLGSRLLSSARSNQTWSIFSVPIPNQAGFFEALPFLAITGSLGAAQGFT